MLHTLPTSSPSRLPRHLIVGLIALWSLLTLFGPMLAQSPSYHAFADQRTLHGLPHAMDVLSNLGFLVAGIAGLFALWRTRMVHIATTARCMAAVFFVGLIGCFAGSSYYHWAPDDAALVWDRLAMCVPFAGILGLAVRQACDDDAAAWLAATAMLICGAASTQIWQHGSNMLPWAVAQGSGMLALIVLACVPIRRGSSLPVHLGVVIGLYALAKVFELADAQVFALDFGLLSGHSAKHLLAAAAALPVLHALAKLRVNAATAFLPNEGTMPVGNKQRC
ncbi:hypothetical protein G7047_27055 [Diaphorobacter sp. HDW4A]|uniref:hypothetical protein n=1 Tax=Diaphorobacter sp. HDW4A TaxID=2714924 RepID=UPI00140C2961|nr:hypothetical protein [Diaphorobacter sp. HDW4A]QIL83189.1 hypothetical protein G7047_27055 [Diaphorobacter sp. HDW4A]